MSFLRWQPGEELFWGWHWRYPRRRNPHSWAVSAGRKTLAVMRAGGSLEAWNIERLFGGREGGRPLRRLEPWEIEWLLRLYRGMNR